MRSKGNSASTEVSVQVVPERGTVVIDESAYLDLPAPGQENFGTFELDIQGDGGVPYDLSEASHIQVSFLSVPRARLTTIGTRVNPGTVAERGTIEQDAFFVSDGRDGRVRCEIPREVYEDRGRFEFQVNIEMRDGSRIGSGIGEINAGEVGAPPDL